MGNLKGNKGTYTFSKLKEIENYKEWARKMTFAFQDTSLISYVSGIFVKPKLSTKKQKNTKNGLLLLLKKKIKKREAQLKK